VAGPVLLRLLADLGVSGRAVRAFEVFVPLVSDYLEQLGPGGH
jgi:hypothetical protein